MRDILRKKDFHEAGLNWASVAKACFTSNWDGRQSIQHRPMKTISRLVKRSNQKKKA